MAPPYKLLELLADEHNSKTWWWLNKDGTPVAQAGMTFVFKVFDQNDAVLYSRTSGGGGITTDPPTGAITVDLPTSVTSDYDDRKLRYLLIARDSLGIAKALVAGDLVFTTTGSL